MYKPQRVQGALEPLGRSLSLRGPPGGSALYQFQRSSHDSRHRGTRSHFQPAGIACDELTLAFADPNHRELVIQVQLFGSRWP
jgi:hypothetical protein